MTAASRSTLRLADRPELRIGGILLAAGASSRMAGTNKMLLELDGEPLVRRAAGRALAAGLSPLAVVVGRDADAVRAALHGLSCEFLLNPSFQEPTSGSLHLGLRALRGRCDAAVILLADMVAVTAPMIAALAAAAAGANAPAAASRYDGVIAPPLYFHHSLFPELLDCVGDGCGKTAIRRHEAEAAFVDWPRAALADVDTPDDLNHLRHTSAPE